MSVAVFNTHAFVKRLTAAGMPEAQAEVLADEQMRLIDDRLATKADIALLATKADITDVRAEIANVRAEFANVRAEIGKMATKSELADAKADILKWMFGSIGFQTIIILGAVIALARFAH